VVAAAADRDGRPHFASGYREHRMLEQKTDFDALGAEALPGGLAEILRTLQPACALAVPEPPVPKKRGVRRFFALSRKQQDIVG